MYFKAMLCDDERNTEISPINIQDDIAGNVVFCAKDYDSMEIFYTEVMNFIKILLNARQKLVVRQEEFNTIVIEYNYDESMCGFGGPEVYWLSPEESREIENFREVHKDNIVKNAYDEIDWINVNE